MSWIKTRKKETVETSRHGTAAVFQFLDNMVAHSYNIIEIYLLIHTKKSTVKFCTVSVIARHIFPYTVNTHSLHGKYIFRVCLCNQSKTLPSMSSQVIYSTLDRDEEQAGNVSLCSVGEEGKERPYITCISSNIKYIVSYNNQQQINGHS